MITPEQLAKSGTESAHQQALFAWAALHVKEHPELALMHAIPNGGMRDKITAGKLKAEGVKAGVWDIFLPIPRHYKHGLYVEMKIEPNKLTVEQTQFGLAIAKAGYGVAVCYSWEAAIAAIESYLKGPYAN